MSKIPPKPQIDKETGLGAPGSTLNPADPNAPNYAFQPVAEGANATDQTIDQGTGVQPATPAPAEAVTGAGSEDADGVTWGDEKTTRGRVITLTTGDEATGTLTREEVLPHLASDADVAAAKTRLLRRSAA